MGIEGIDPGHQEHFSRRGGEGAATCPAIHCALPQDAWTRGLMGAEI